MKKLLFYVLFCIVSYSSAVAKESHALLIGASTYPNLKERYWLKGPANDVDLVATYLTTNPAVPFAPENITILADGVAGKKAPTLAAIRTAFAELAERVAPGDFVYLHFSGHGSQAPAQDPDSELDGLDELFLPVDIGPWNDQVGTVENALVDDEIGTLIDSIRAKGADVWAVFDSCHSGTATRAAPSDDDVRMRKLEPDALGIPDGAMADAQVNSRALSSATERPSAPVDTIVADGSTMGSLTAFFAAQTNETTPEKNMPKGQKDRRLQGVFTYILFETLAERPSLTYRQLGQEVLRKYSVKNLARSTPMFEGDLDANVFGQGEADRLLQWPVSAGKTVTVGAGSLHGLVEGAELLLLASPADTNDQALATFKVSSSTTFKSVVVPVGQDIEIPKGAVVRKSAGIVDFSLTIALPSSGEGAHLDKFNDALAIIKENELVGPRVKFTQAGNEADIRLGVIPESNRPDAIWFLPETGVIDDHQLNSTLSVSTSDKTPQELAEVIAENINAISKATNLLKIGASSAAGKLPVDAQLTTAKFDDDLEDVIGGSRGIAEDVKVPRLVPNDVIGLDLKNNADYAIDFNILYVGSDYSISFMDNGRMQPGAVLTDDYVLVTDAAFGKDRMLVILSPAEEQSEVQDLSFLEQGPLERSRSTGGSGIAGLLDEAGFGQTTRAAVSLSSRKKKKSPLPMIVQFEVETIPNNE